MANKGRDLSRGRKLTAAEAGDNAKVRRQVMEEIPPAVTNIVRQVIAQLRQVCEAQGLSLADMEARTGMTRANLCRLENEGRNVQMWTVERYARALGCRIEVQLVRVAPTKAQAQV
jgi:DNA-binding Xre family transcriptional regulator